MVKWATAEISRKIATIGPRGRLIAVSVTGQSLSVSGMKVKNDVVMGSLKSLLKMNIKMA
jgi:hypothetical protein